jgi:hypothetical protein
VKLTTPRYAGLTVLLEPNEEVTNVQGGKSIVRQGRKIQFRNHIAEVPESWLPLVEQHPSFTGEGRERSIYLWDEVTTVGDGPDTGVKVVQGAMGTRTRAAESPHPDWDTMTPKEILTLIDGWPNARLEAAQDWELARRRRKAVLLGIVQELVGDKAEDPQPLVEKEAKAKDEAKAAKIAESKGGGPIADVFEAKIPSGQDGV